jgi:adenylate kinase family enzyme
MRLEELGERICILGPSNSGKSTLAAAIARKRGLRAVHLDQLHHLPQTDWKVRPSHEFVALHDEAIANDRWVMDGNYSKLFPKRFRACDRGYPDGHLHRRELISLRPQDTF